MKQGRQIKKLGCLCSFERGLTYSKGDEAAISTKGVLRSNNVDLSSNTLNFDEIKYLKDDIDIPVSKKVKRNSILMCMSNGSKAHLGKVAIIEDDLDYAFGGFMGLLVPDEEAVFPRYFYYALITPMYKSFIKSLSDGANINNLKFADLKEFEIPVPSISEQQCIVALLDAEFAKIDALKANAEKNLQNAKDLFQAALKKELEPKEGWINIQLQEYFDITSSKRVFQSEWRKEGIPFYRAREIVKLSKYGSVDNDLFIDPEMYELYKKKYGVPMIGDILITGVGTLGVCYLVSDNTPFYFKDGNVIWLKKQKEISSRFVVLSFLSDDVQSQVHSTQGAVVGTYTIEKAKSTTISIPQNIEEQDRITTRLDILIAKCKTLQANYEKTLSLCDDLKQALLRKAFNGEI